MILGAEKILIYEIFEQVVFVRSHSLSQISLIHSLVLTSTMVCEWGKSGQYYFCEMKRTAKRCQLLSPHEPFWFFLPDDNQVLWTDLAELLGTVSSKWMVLQVQLMLTSFQESLSPGGWSVGFFLFSCLRYTSGVWFCCWANLEMNVT